MRAFRLFALITILVSCAYSNGRQAAAEPIKSEEMKEWLTFLASDDLEGRATFSEGLGIAAEFIGERLKSWGVKPGGDHGTYFQRVAVLGIKATDHSTITVETNGQSRTFDYSKGFTWARTGGGKQNFYTDKIEFLGYGLTIPGTPHDDFAGKDLKGKLAVWMGNGPSNIGQGAFRLLSGRGRTAVEEHGAIGGIGPPFGFGRRGGGGRSGVPAQATGQPGTQTSTMGQAVPPPGLPAQPPAGRGQVGAGQLENPDFTTAERIDTPKPPLVSAQDEFMEFLFSGQDVKYAELKEKASKREPIPGFTLKNVKITFNVNAEYRIVRTQYTRNVVGIVGGRDNKLSNTYVAFGAHYDHVGYAEGEVAQGNNGPRRLDARGKVTDGTADHRIWNGADDDGSGTVTLLSIAKSFAKGPKPKRSLLFVWHAGEERGLWGSRYYADTPTIPLDKIVAQLDMDMVGRNRDNKKEEEQTVYLVGSDRISTELHNLAVDANTKLPAPLKLSFEFNDPADTEQIYYRSDHYSYAAKGIPVIFYTTGLHPDYHANTDTPDRIDYTKMAKIGDLVYRTGMAVANLDHPPVRDNKGPRAGKGTSGKI